MIGHQNFTEQNGPFGAVKWSCDVVGDQKGILAVLPYSEVKAESRKYPKAVCKLHEMAARRAYETTYFNIMGAEYNPVPTFISQLSMQRKVRDLFFKNQVFRTFLNGLDKRDERIIMAETQARKCSAGDRVIRKGTRERALFIVVQGQFMTLGEEQTIYHTGAILGFNQFLHGDSWQIDLMSKTDNGVIGKISFSSYQNIKAQNPSTAVRFYSRVYRSLQYELIYSRKNDRDFYERHMARKVQVLDIKDEDLIIDFKFGSTETIHNMFTANAAN